MDVLCRKLRGLRQREPPRSTVNLDVLEDTDTCKTDGDEVCQFFLVRRRVHGSSEVHPVKRLEGVDDDKPVGSLELFRVPCCTRISCS